METSSDKKILILAGPNGAGKTTFAREFLTAEAACPNFVNADLIAAGLSPFEPNRAAVRAGRLMLELIHELVDNGESFAFETTLASESFARWIPKWRADGYTVELFFLSLSSVSLALARVAQRVRQGGTGVPEEVVRSQFQLGREHFESHYKELVDVWALYDNSGAVSVPADSMGESMNAKLLDDPRSRNFLFALSALQRARRRAEEVAHGTGTSIVQVVDGRLEYVEPQR